MADAVADRGKSKSILERSGQQIESLSETDKAYLASKGITLEATRHGVKVTGLQDARNSLSKDRDAGLIRIGNDNFAIQWADDRTGFLDTGASHVTGVDGGGVQFNFDTSTGRDGFTSDWLTVGDSDAMRFLSRGDQTYLYMGGTERFDALGVTARFGQYISDLPLGDGGGLGFAMDFVVTGGASAVGQLAVAGGRAALMEVVVPLAARAMSPSASRVGLRAGYEVASSTARAADMTIPRTILEFGGCFVAGTLVHTPDGLQPIERLQIGDLVLSQPETGGERDARKIVRTVTFGDKAIWQVSYADSSGQMETVYATGNHLFWVEGIGWTAAEFLEPGQLLQLADGSSAAVASVHDTGVFDRVFNFEVDGFHTYYVGLQGAWVHNTNCSAPISAAERTALSPATNVVDGVRLRSQLMSQEIAGGHAFDKHVLGVGNPSQAEFGGLGIRTRNQFAEHIENVINNPTESGPLLRGREYFYDRTTNTIVIRNPRAVDGGTAFRPTDPDAYIKNLR